MKTKRYQTHITVQIDIQSPKETYAGMTKKQVKEYWEKRMFQAAGNFDKVKVTL